MQEEVENRTVNLAISTGKISARLIMKAALKGMAMMKHKLTAGKNQKPVGKQTIKELIGQNQGVEKTELADKEEVKTFDRIAKQYGVDYAIKKGTSPEGKKRYILFFKARDRSAIDQAMSEYALEFVKKHHREHPPVEQVLDPLKEMLPNRKKERVRDKGMQR